MRALDSGRRTSVNPMADDGSGDAAATVGGHFSLDEFYGRFPEIEEEFKTLLDESLDPRGPDYLFDVVDAFDLPAGAVAVDVGCGEGRFTFELADRFGFRVAGIDPVERHIAVAKETMDDYAHLRSRVSFTLGYAEELPAADSSVDLVWCRDVLSHVPEITTASAEFRRVLREDGHILVYQMFATHRLESAETQRLWRTMGVVPSSADVQATQQAFAAGGLHIDECIVIGTEFGEWAEERSGRASRALVHASRLLRSPDVFIERFGKAAYDIMLGDCLWHVYAMIGKLERRIYLLSSV